MVHRSSLSSPWDFPAQQIIAFLLEDCVQCWFWYTPQIPYLVTLSPSHASELFHNECNIAGDNLNRKLRFNRKRSTCSFDTWLQSCDDGLHMKSLSIVYIFIVMQEKKGQLQRESVCVKVKGLSSIVVLFPPHRPVNKTAIGRFLSLKKHILGTPIVTKVISSEG